MKNAEAVLEQLKKDFEETEKQLTKAYKENNIDDTCIPVATKYRVLKKYIDMLDSSPCPKDQIVKNDFIRFYPVPTNKTFLP